MSDISIEGQNFDFSKEEIKHFGDADSTVAIRLESLKDEPPQFSQKVADKIASVYPELVPEDRNDFILSIEKVGPKVGAELSGDAVLAIFSALALILIYISIRFEFKYAVGAIAALTHDVAITLGISHSKEFLRGGSIIPEVFLLLSVDSFQHRQFPYQ